MGLVGDWFSKLFLLSWRAITWTNWWCWKCTHCGHLPVLFKWSSKSFFFFSWRLHHFHLHDTCRLVQIQDKDYPCGYNNPFCCKSNLPGERLTPSWNHRRKGGNDHALLFSLISRIGAPLIWTECFADRRVCLHSTEDKMRGWWLPKSNGSWLYKWLQKGPWQVLVVSSMVKVLI